MYRNRRYVYGPQYGVGYGYGRGYGRFGPGASYGPGRGRRFYSPNCDWYPDRPRGWWAMPEYQNPDDIGWTAPPAGARWDPYSGVPENQEAIDYEISRVEKEVESLQKEIEYLRKLKKA